jgi:hypothetical protein
MRAAQLVIFSEACATLITDTEVRMASGQGALAGYRGAKAAGISLREDMGLVAIILATLVRRIKMLVRSKSSQNSQAVTTPKPPAPDVSATPNPLLKKRQMR